MTQSQRGENGLLAVGVGMCGDMTESGGRLILTYVRLNR